MRLRYKRKKLKYEIKNENIKYRGYKIMEPEQGLKIPDILLIYPQIFGYMWILTIVLWFKHGFFR